MGADGNQKERTSELIQQVMKLLGYLPINFHLSLAGIKCPAPQKPSGGESETTSGVESGSWQLLELSTMATGGLRGSQGWHPSTNG